jgi:hypothetical protein
MALFFYSDLKEEVVAHPLSEFPISLMLKMKEPAGQHLNQQMRSKGMKIN